MWNDAQEQAFRRIKDVLTKPPTLVFFDLTKTIIVQADASNYGLGAALIQEGKGNKDREVVAYASRTLSESEKRYSQIEKEALALSYACEHFRDYIVGIDVVLETDHKPLLQILQTKPLDELTPRLQRIRMRLMRYSYHINFVPGKRLILADYLSRAPVDNSTNAGDDLPEEVKSYVKLIIAGLPASRNMLGRIKSEQQSDYICKNMIKYCLKGWPAKNGLAGGLLPYFAFKDNISYAGGYLLYNSRLVIPSALQVEILNNIHSGHLGVSKCRARASQSV